MIPGEMLDAIAAIREYTQGATWDVFAANQLMQDGVIRRFEILGEAATQLSDALKRQFPEVQWRAMTAMRNRLIHAYFTVDLTIVWDSVQHDLAPIEAHIQRIRTSLAQAGIPTTPPETGKAVTSTSSAAEPVAEPVAEPETDTDAMPASDAEQGMADM